MEARKLADPPDLAPLQLGVAYGLINAWEPQWWDAARTATETPPLERLHGDVHDPAEAAELITQWAGRNFPPAVSAYFAIHLTGLRLRLGEFLAEEHTRLSDDVDELRDDLEKLRSLVAGAGAVLREATGGVGCEPGRDR